jgi:hypothetical protein
MSEQCSSNAQLDEEGGQMFAHDDRATRASTRAPRSCDVIWRHMGASGARASSSWRGALIKRLDISHRYNFAPSSRYRRWLDFEGALQTRDPTRSRVFAFHHATSQRLLHALKFSKNARLFAIARRRGAMAPSPL